MTKKCTYCDGLIGYGGKGVGDHAPLPRSVGGTVTVPCCVSCHEMKDNFPLDTWPTEWWLKVSADFPKLNRETRIFLAKAARIFAESQKTDAA